MDTLDFQPTIQTKAIVVKSAVNRDTDAVIMIAEIDPNESGPPLCVVFCKKTAYLL